MPEDPPFHLINLEIERCRTCKISYSQCRFSFLAHFFNGFFPSLPCLKEVK